MTAPTRELPRLLEHYRTDIAPALQQEFGLANVMQIPRLTKIVVNMGVGEATRDAKLMDGAVRDLSATQFDGHGNYTFGLTEQSMFREIDVDKIDRPRGMDITLVTTATTDEEGRELLRQLGFPFAGQPVVTTTR